MKQIGPTGPELGPHDLFHFLGLRPREIVGQHLPLRADRGSRLLAMKSRYEFIHDVRWRGLMLDVARQRVGGTVSFQVLGDGVVAAAVGLAGDPEWWASFGQTVLELMDGEPQEVSSVLSSEQLPMGDEDDALLGLLTRLESSDTAERAQVARELASHRAQRSVSALCSTAMHDPDPSVRAAAVAGTLAIESEPGEGTRIIVRLPLGSPERPS